MPDAISSRGAGADHQADPNPLRSVWDAAAADYEAFAEPFNRQFAEASLALSGGVEPGERILDVGAGTGGLALAAAHTGTRVLATDFSPRMLATLSRRLAAEGGSEGASARVMDGQALEFEKGSFDATLSVSCVMLFPGRVRGLATLARANRPGESGVVAVLTNENGAGPASPLAEARWLVFPSRIRPPLPGMSRLKDADVPRAETERAVFRDVVLRREAGFWSAPSALGGRSGDGSGSPRERAAPGARTSRGQGR